MHIAAANPKPYLFCREQIIIAAVFDNLGKGASGAAVQNMNIMFGFDETLSLK